MTRARTTASTACVCTLCGGAWVGTGQGSATCSACGVPSSFVAVPQAPRDFSWARIEARTTCPDCGVTSPLNGLLLGPTISCSKCGATHGFDGRIWQRLLPMIHEIVDLAGTSVGVLEMPALSSASNAHSHIGLQVATRDLIEASAVAGRERLHLRVGPGLPVDGDVIGTRTSGQALHVLSANQGTIQVAGADQKPCTFRLQPEVLGLYAPLRAAVAPAHRADYNYSILKQDKDSSHICCSRCGAPGKTEDGVTLVCVYCGTTSLVSGTHWHQLGIGKPRVVGFWLLFAGACGKRTELTKRGGADDIQAQIRAAALAASGGGGPRWE